MALALAWTAGFVDAGCYLRLHRTYTSHMTGATASLASGLARGMWMDAARFACALASFLFGLLLSATLQHLERRRGIHSSFKVVLALEIAFLLLYIWWSGSPSAPLLALVFPPAAAMGLQTVTVTRVGKSRVYTTFLTGSLSKFSETVTAYIFWAWDRTRGRFRKRMLRVLRLSPRHMRLRQAAVVAGLWVFFLAGALAGVAGDNAWGSSALLLPVAALALISVLDWLRPAALGDFPED